jgi:hypothetical protein
MNEFDLKWKQCAARAQGSPTRDESAPFGFAARAIARARDRTSGPLPIELVWQRLTLRSLGLVGALLLVCAVIELPHLRDRKPLDPGIEDTVARLVWNL